MIHWSTVFFFDLDGIRSKISLQPIIPLHKVQTVELAYRKKKGSGEPMGLQGSHKVMILVQSGTDRTNKFVGSLQRQLGLLDRN